MERRARVKKTAEVASRAGLFITAAAVAYAIFVRYAGRSKAPPTSTLGNIRMNSEPKV